VLGPRLVEALVGKTVIGAAGDLAAAWTEASDLDLFTFGGGALGRLGHAGHEDEATPRLVEELSGKKVVGVSADRYHTAVWTDAAFHLWGRRLGEAGPRKATSTR